MMSVGRQVGRLCEVRYAAPLTGDELGQFTLGVRSIVTAAGEPLYFCCDWRKVARFEPDFLDTIIWTMRRDNPKIAQNVMLVDPREHAFRRQVEQIIAESRSDRRVVVDDPQTMLALLDPKLAPDERARLRAFLEA